MNPPSVLGKMKASGEESGHSCFYSQRSSTIPLGSAVQDHRAILETALARGMGETTYAQIRLEFERRIEAGEFREIM
jgi:hypothetical protein